MFLFRLVERLWGSTMSHKRPHEIYYFSNTTKSLSVIDGNVQASVDIVSSKWLSIALKWRSKGEFLYTVCLLLKRLAKRCSFVHMLLCRNESVILARTHGTPSYAVHSLEVVDQLPRKHVYVHVDTDLKSDWHNFCEAGETCYLVTRFWHCFRSSSQYLSKKKECVKIPVQTRSLVGRSYITERSR